MRDIRTLDVFLHGEKIGVLTNLPGDKNIFSFTDSYRNSASRPTLSVSYLDVVGDLIEFSKPTQTRLPPFFSNLLPEGPLRTFLAEEAGIATHAEFLLLQTLGKDLAGAVQVIGPEFSQPEHAGKQTQKNVQKQREMHFSLAGVQLKFSAEKSSDRLTVSVDGSGGSWIVKLASAEYADVAQNEFYMMELAKRVGIDVPEIELIELSQVSGVPERIKNSSEFAFAIRRFDRDDNGRLIHIEDFAQVFGLYPEKKYRAANYRNIAEVIWTEVGEKGLREYIRRLVFTILIANGDMHLKNWSLIYRDKITAEIAPAYDFVSTLPYIPDDTLALNFLYDKSFYTITRASFVKFSLKAHLPEKIVLDTVDETIFRFFSEWEAISKVLPKRIVQVIDRHLELLDTSFITTK